MKTDNSQTFIKLMVVLGNELIVNNLYRISWIVVQGRLYYSA